MKKLNKSKETFCSKNISRKRTALKEVQEEMSEKKPDCVRNHINAITCFESESVLIQLSIKLC